MPLQGIIDLEEDEFYALAEAVAEQRRVSSWSQTDELLAGILDALAMVVGRLNGGLHVQQVKKVSSPRKTTPFPRPAWVKAAADDDEVVVMSPRQLMQRMSKGGRA